MVVLVIVVVVAAAAVRVVLCLYVHIALKWLVMFKYKAVLEDRELAVALVAMVGMALSAESASNTASH